MDDNSAGKLLRYLEGGAYWVAVAPVLARLPAALGYRIACWRGDLLFRCQAGKRTEVARNIRLVLGNDLSPAAAQQVTRDWFRFASCQAALTAGKGAILCSAHFGSHRSGFSLLHASGFPLTSIGRRAIRRTDHSPAERRFWDLAYRPVRRYRQRSAIEPLPGRIQVAALAAAALRNNEVVTVSIDAPPVDGDRARAIEVPFLDGHARLLPGAVTLAQLTGAPLLMGFLYRSADYRHQVLEISPPVPVEGETVRAFGRCVAAMDAAIRTSPAHWAYWANADDLASLGLLQTAPSGTAAVSPQSTVGEPATLPEDGPLSLG